MPVRPGLSTHAREGRTMRPEFLIRVLYGWLPPDSLLHENMVGTAACGINCSGHLFVNCSRSVCAATRSSTINMHQWAQGDRRSSTNLRLRPHRSTQQPTTKSSVSSVETLCYLQPYSVPVLCLAQPATRNSWSRCHSDFDRRGSSVEHPWALAVIETTLTKRGHWRFLHSSLFLLLTTGTGIQNIAIESTTDQHGPEQDAAAILGQFNNRQVEWIKWGGSLTHRHHIIPQ